MKTKRQPDPKAFQEFQESHSEFWKAGERLTARANLYGATEPAVAAWLLEFSQKDLRRLSAGQFSDKMWEAARFSFDAGLGIDARGGVISSPYHRIDLKRLESLRRKTRLVVSQLLKNGWADLPSIRGTRRVVAGKGIRPKARLPLFLSKTIADSFFFWAGELLDRYGRRISQCEGCQSLFLGRRRQKYHDDNCRIRTFVRTQRGTPPSRYWKPGRPRKDEARASTRIKGRRKYGTKR